VEACGTGLVLVLNCDQISPFRQRLSLSIAVQLAFEGTAPTTSIREVLARKFSGNTATQVVAPYCER
jgi:hypothetical protein